jgi:hypothetical protein
MEEKYSKEMITLIKQIKNIAGSIVSRQYQTKERISDMEDKIEKILHADNHKEKK